MFSYILCLFIVNLTQIPQNKMGQKVIMRIWLESGLSSLSQEPSPTFCRYACLWSCYLICQFIRNNCLILSAMTDSNQRMRWLNPLAALPISVAW